MTLNSSIAGGGNSNMFTTEFLERDGNCQHVTRTVT